VTFLLDVNVLIALIDPGHVAHDDAHAWFQAEGQAGWSTCPLTENGVVRIVGNPKYPNSPRIAGHGCGNRRQIATIARS
jgi:predicted nucleic acid-binding protein